MRERLVRGGRQAFLDAGLLTTAALNLAAVLCERGRYDEVRDLCERARTTTDAEDVVNFVMLDVLEGSLLAREGRFDEAEECARRGLERAETTDFVGVRAHSRVYLAETLALAGKREEALDHARDALDLLEAKGDRRRGARSGSPHRGRRPRRLIGRRRALLTSRDGHRASPGGRRAAGRIRAQVREGRAHVRRRAAPPR